MAISTFGVSPGRLDHLLLLDEVGVADRRRSEDAELERRVGALPFLGLIEQPFGRKLRGGDAGAAIVDQERRWLHAADGVEKRHAAILAVPERRAHRAGAGTRSRTRRRRSGRSATWRTGSPSGHRSSGRRLRPRSRGGPASFSIGSWMRLLDADWPESRIRPIFLPLGNSYGPPCLAPSSAPALAASAFWASVSTYCQTSSWARAAAPVPRTKAPARGTSELPPGEADSDQSHAGSC